MNLKINKLVATALTSTFLLGFGVNAMADSTFDLVQALIKKGVLTEEEGLELMKGRDNDIHIADDKVKKATRLGISDAIDNAKLYGDIRVRGESRKGSGYALTAAPVTTQKSDEDRTRARYKLTFGVKTEANDFYTDLAFAMGASGRSDNATFGQSNGANSKDTLFVKRAMIGWNATDWLTLEAGRITNPLYTTPMVWDADLTMEGLSEQFKFNFGDTDVFLTAVQSQYLGDRKTFSNVGVDKAGGRTTNELLAFQGGAKVKINDNVSAKAALTYTTYTNEGAAGIFIPGTGTGASFGTNTTAINDLKTIEIPAELTFNTSGTINYKVFGDYAFNLDGSNRKDAACAAATGLVKTAVCNAGTDDKAWMLGAGIGNVQDPKGKKSTKGDWEAKLWYQSVGAYSVDPNTPDSDFMDSRLNMKGIVLKGQYNLRDNVFINLAAGHATRKNNDISAVGTSTNDIGLNLKDYDLYQLDMTYKF